MNTQEKINKDRNFKELSIKMLEYNNNYNQCQKEMIKILFEMLHEVNKRNIIKNDRQVIMLDN